MGELFHSFWTVVSRSPILFIAFTLIMASIEAVPAILIVGLFMGLGKIIYLLVIAAALAILLFGYWASRSLLAKHGFELADSGFFKFVVASFVTAVATQLGLFLFVLPGLFVMARFCLVPLLVLHTPISIMGAARVSWERTSLSYPSIMIVLALLLLPMLVSWMGSLALMGSSNASMIFTLMDALAAAAAFFLPMAVFRLLVAPSAVAYEDEARIA